MFSLGKQSDEPFLLYSFHYLCGIDTLFCAYRLSRKNRPCFCPAQHPLPFSEENRTGLPTESLFGDSMSQEKKEDVSWTRKKGKEVLLSGCCMSILQLAKHCPQTFSGIHCFRKNLVENFNGRYRVYLPHFR